MREPEQGPVCVHEGLKSAIFEGDFALFLKGFLSFALAFHSFTEKES